MIPRLLRKIMWYLSGLGISLAIFTVSLRAAKEEVKGLAKEIIAESVEENIKVHRTQMRTEIKGAVKEGVEDGIDKKMEHIPDWMK